MRPSRPTGADAAPLGGCSHFNQHSSTTAVAGARPWPAELRPALARTSTAPRTQAKRTVFLHEVDLPFETTQNLAPHRAVVAQQRLRVGGHGYIVAKAGADDGVFPAVEAGVRIERSEYDERGDKQRHVRLWAVEAAAFWCCKLRQASEAGGKEGAFALTRIKLKPESRGLMTSSLQMEAIKGLIK